MPRRIAILFHEQQKNQSRMEYTVCRMATIWKELGHDVTFLFGIRQFVPADLLIVHVDLSVVPDPYLEFASRYPKALNGTIKDVRKSAFSKNLLRADDPYEGPVIVKSNLNFAGIPEQLLVGRGIPVGTQLKNVWRSLSRIRTGRRPSRFKVQTEYPVYPSLRDVPVRCFSSPALVVEKFLPERDGEQYVVRVMNFLGDRTTCVRIGSNEPIVKFHNTISRTEVEPHPEMVELRQALQFDFGKFDYVVHDGRAIPLDLNKTPGTSEFPTARLQTRLRYRADGLFAYFS